jgi:CDP-glucose 4,6-dehydratase
MEIISEFYKDKKVLVTGHTGFKGSWLSIWLNMLGAKVIGIALDPKNEWDNFVLSGISSEIKDYRADIRNLDTIKGIIDKEKPEILFHLAAQPIVLDSYINPAYTYETNVMGTVNLLEAFRLSGSMKTGVFITTDKCYENIEKNYSYKETDPLGGYDPYSSSKGAAELVISSYRRSFFRNSDKKIASVRAGNVIGGGDWSENRILPDIMRALQTDMEIGIRNPFAIRPWQHVLEPLGGYLLLAAKMQVEQQYDEAWNFGPEIENIVSVKELLEEVIRHYGSGRWKIVSSEDQFHEATLLSLNISKALANLNWKPKLNLYQTVKLTVEWYKAYKSGNVNSICKNQINEYMSI